MNVVPIIAKADTISRSELSQFKARVSVYVRTYVCVHTYVPLDLLEDCVTSNRSLASALSN